MQAPDVSIVKGVVGSNLVPGGPIQFKLTIANAGPGAASAIVITDLMPSQVTNLSYSSTLPVALVAGSPYKWNLAALAAGASGTITINGKLSAGLPKGWVFINAATITAPNDSNSSNNSSRVVVGGKKVYLPMVRKP